jgi:hypothetical protein
MSRNSFVTERDGSSACIAETSVATRKTTTAAGVHHTERSAMPRPSRIPYARIANAISGRTMWNGFANVPLTDPSSKFVSGASASAAATPYSGRATETATRAAPPTSTGKTAGFSA